MMIFPQETEKKIVTIYNKVLNREIGDSEEEIREGKESVKESNRQTD